MGVERFVEEVVADAEQEVVGLGPAFDCAGRDLHVAGEVGGVLVGQDLHRGVAAVAGDEDVRPGQVGGGIILVDDEGVALALHDEVVAQFFECDFLGFQVGGFPVPVDFGLEDDLV